jgi:hypothetical protein
MRTPGRQHRDNAGQRRSRRQATRGARWVAAAATLAIGLSACGNWVTVTDAGQLGISVDPAGQPVVAVMTCSNARPVIGLFESRKKTDPDSKPNTRRGNWEARRPFAGVRKLAILAPGPTWKAASSLRSLERGKLFVLDGGTVEDSNASLGGASFRVDDLSALSPGDVLVNGKTQSWSDFGRYKCG